MLYYVAYVESHAKHISEYPYSVQNFRSPKISNVKYSSQTHCQTS